MTVIFVPPFPTRLPITDIKSWKQKKSFQSNSNSLLDLIQFYEQRSHKLSPNATVQSSENGEAFRASGQKQSLAELLIV